MSMSPAKAVLLPHRLTSVQITRSKWHVPVQVTGSVIAIIGYFLGHGHKGRQFEENNIHSIFVPVLMLLLVAQIVMGIYLKLHLQKGINGKIRKVVVMAHGVVGKAMPVVTWVQFVFGGLTALKFCKADHTGQCLAHFIMGSAFIAYGILLTILLLVGQLWLKRTGRSQEFFDSIVIAAWGCVNTFTEHRWGGPWAHNDLQHTSMGIIWWAAGLVGIWLSRKRDGSPKRNLIPGIVIFVTGWAMSSHPQHLPISTMIHTVFGYTLMAAGGARIIEIAFVLKDRSATTPDGSDPNSFQYMTPFLLFASGFLFMGATEEQMQLLADANVSHVSYVLILYSIAFVLFLCKSCLVLNQHKTNQQQSSMYLSMSTPSMHGATKRSTPKHLTRTVRRMATLVSTTESKTLRSLSWGVLIRMMRMPIRPMLKKAGPLLCGKFELYL
jgi:hypothetical protein